ncbi:MAG: erythromycin esterase family protein [Paludibacteraceae bacterium]|nr:erythromycin esterase family protein [Paludibacteraceae bacterium]
MQYPESNKIDTIKEYKWNSFVKENSVPISFSSVENNCDFSFLKNIIGEKSIVFLGEQSHCCKEFNLIKGELVKFLYKEKKFDVIAFEISMNGYCIRNLKKKNLTLAEFSTGTWNTKENIDLFKFIKDSMELTGIDLVPQQFSQHLKQLFWPIDTTIANFCAKIDSSITKLSQYYLRNTRLVNEKGSVLHYEFYSRDSMLNFEKKAHELILFIDTTKMLVDRKKSLLKISDKELFLNKKLIENKKVYTHYLLKQFSWIYRDSVMGQNLKWLAEEYYGNKNIIVWAANAHITNNGILTRQLNAQFSKKQYHIALLNSSGTSRHLFTADALFIDLSKFKNIKFNREYYNDLLKNFDAVILVKNTTSCEPKY